MKRIGRSVNKILAIFLAFALTLSLLCHGSLAYTVGPDSDYESIVYSIPLNINAPDLHAAALAWAVTNGANRENYQYMFISVATNSVGNPVGISIFLSSSPIGLVTNSYVATTGTDPVYLCMFSDGVLQLYEFTLNWNGNSFSQFGYTWNMFSLPWQDNTVPNGVWYANYSIEDVVTLSNLDASGYIYNPYALMVEAGQSSQYGGTYLSLRVRSIDVDPLISFAIDYTSSLGSYTAYVFYDDLVRYPGDDYDLFLMNPNYISSGEFTVTGVTFFGLNGNASDLGLSLVFNEDAYTYDPINLSYTYFNQFTEVSYNGGIGVPYFDQTLYFYTDGNTAAYLWDSSENLVQPFKFSIMAFPSFSSSYPYAFYLNDLPAYVELSSGLSDVLLLNVSESCFDRLYGAGSYLNFGNLLSQAYPDTELMTEMLNTWYASHNMQYRPLPYSESYTPNYSESATVYLTSSFFFRQVNYSLGDTADILNEFSVRFFQQDGFSHNLFQSLNDIGSNEDSFFKDAIMYLSNINYSLNDLKFNDTLQDITELLQSVNQGLSTLNSLDGSLDALVEDSSDSLQLLGSSDQSLSDLLTNSGSVLSLLTDGNGDISSILQWLENSSVVTSFDLDLPSFDFGGIVSTFGGNIDSFGDWVNELVLVLPDLDYSDFDDWFTNAGNLLTGIDADSNFLGHLGDPYDYSDSGVNYLGWD